jgi:hypothetical protein
MNRKVNTKANPGLSQSQGKGEKRPFSVMLLCKAQEFIWPVKGNQPQLLQELQDWFDPKVDLLPGMGSPPKDFRSSTITSKGHGRSKFAP